MTLPARLIEILASHTAHESMQCDDCAGSGETSQHSDQTGTEPAVCETCLGSGYNQLGLILSGILKPPPEGYGSVELKDALNGYLRELAAREPENSELGLTLSLALATVGQAIQPEPQSRENFPRKRRVS